MKESRQPIDRQALVQRHSIIQTGVNLQSPLSVGNGAFCSTADITGLQTFDDAYRFGEQGHFPLSTMSDWGWHHKPNPDNYSWETFPHTPYTANGRTVDYLYWEQGKSPADLGKQAKWLYEDPNHFHLGKIGLILMKKNGERAAIQDIENPHQELDLWTGVLKSQFTLEGERVIVTTVCHGKADQIGVAVESALIAGGRLRVEITFPYPSGDRYGCGADWGKPEAHETVLTTAGNNRADFQRTIDTDSYHSALQWSAPGQLVQTGRHCFQLACADDQSRVEFVCAFSRTPLTANLSDYADTIHSAAQMWQLFWSSGGAIDLSESRDPRWFELERRIVLSQYVTRIQSVGTLPPQETGLTANSWAGKFHMEMYWWHAAHFATWGRQELLEKSMPFYRTMLPVARKIARDQGYMGARWPKCVGPEGTPAPNYIEAFLLWQQPHPIFLAELCYRAGHGAVVLDRYKDIVFETAEFMASFPFWDAEKGHYNIGLPAADAAEIYHHDAATNCNFNFENSYWHFGLEIAQRWRQRLGLARNPLWDHILSHLPPLAIKDGVYVAGETQTKTWEADYHWSHPDMIAPLGVFDGAMVDHDIMRATLRKVMNEWDWSKVWGWDFPEVAMCAARLGDGSTAVDALLMDNPKNTYLPNGHNWQSDHLPLYLPGNGGLLYAVALMAAGWDGAPQVNAPGFPQDGSWVVRWENLVPAPADYNHPVATTEGVVNIN